MSKVEYETFETNFLFAELRCLTTLLQEKAWSTCLSAVLSISNEIKYNEVSPTS